MRRILFLILLLLLILITVKPTVAANWTVMIYMDGDNDLEEYAIENFLQIASVGSNNDVNVVILLDRIPGCDDSYGDWTGAKVFYITRGITPTPDNALDDWGEVNMGDPQTLFNFVNWSVHTYKANHYALILWDHGSGWKFRNVIPLKGVCYDFTNKTVTGESDYLTLEDLESALSRLRSHGINLDIIGFDACLMGMLEVSY